MRASKTEQRQETLRRRTVRRVKYPRPSVLRVTL